MRHTILLLMGHQGVVGCRVSARHACRATREHVGQLQGCWWVLECMLPLNIASAQLRKKHHAWTHIHKASFMLACA
jgi:hypothetical protein